MTSKIRIIIFLAITVICGAEPILRSDVHNYFNCPEPEKAKILILDEPINTAPPLLFFQVKSKTIVFPENEINTNKITCIQLKDLDIDDTGGYPSVIDGGIGNYNVLMRFVSQPGRGFNFRVRIWGDEEEGN